MHRWTPLNNRQSALLTRISAGDGPVPPDLLRTAQVLKERGLVSLTDHAGAWKAEITEAGRFYLEHGHHPDRPAPRRRQRDADQGSTATASDERTGPERNPGAKGGAGRGSQPAHPPRLSGPALVAQVQQAGRFLRITDPGDAERARYRRAFDAARQCAPQGYHLKYTGRAKGDIVFGLLRATGEDDTEWNRLRLARSRMLTDVDDVIAAVEANPAGFEVSEELLPRALAVLRLLAERALTLRGSLGVPKKRTPPRPQLSVYGRTWEVTLQEERKQVPSVPGKNRSHRTYAWQRVTPEHRWEPTGKLTLRLALDTGSYQPGPTSEWPDRDDKPVETQTDAVFRALRKTARELDKGERERAERHRQQREEYERAAVERRRREAEEQERIRREWQGAVDSAAAKAVEAARSRRFQQALEHWHSAGAIREFCDALDDTATRTADPDEVDRLNQWSAWGREEADRIDPTHVGTGLGAHDFSPRSTPDELRPHLDGWHPERPEKEHQPQQRHDHDHSSESWREVNDAFRSQGWRYGHPGRAQWWRR